MPKERERRGEGGGLMALHRPSGHSPSVGSTHLLPAACRIPTSSAFSFLVPACSSVCRTLAIASACIFAFSSRAIEPDAEACGGIAGTPKGS